MMFSGERVEVAERLCERASVGTGDEVALDDHRAPVVGILSPGGEFVLFVLTVDGGDYRVADPVRQRASRDPVIDRRVVADM